MKYPSEIGEVRPNGFINSNIQAIERTVSNIHVCSNQIENLYSTLFGAFPQEPSPVKAPGSAASNLESQLNLSVQELELAVERLCNTVNRLVEHPL